MKKFKSALFNGKKKKLSSDLQQFGTEVVGDDQDNAVKDVDKALGESVDVDSTEHR